MGDKTHGERLGIVETKLEHFEDRLAEFVAARAARATREWAVIMTGIGLVATIVAKNLGWI